MGEKQLIEIERLAGLIEDSLSACAGWTVPCPAIQLGTLPNAQENWFVDLDGLDPMMVRAIESLQRRFGVKASGAAPCEHGPFRTAPA
ncbi:MAG: hypothetical protein PGN26_10190 [Xylophilus ampelinus]